MYVLLCGNCHVSKAKLCSLVNGHTAIYVLKSLPLETWQFPQSNAYVSHEKHTRSNHACPSSIRKRSNLADILQNLAAKKPVKSWLLCVAMGNLRFKNSYICTEIRLSAPKITKTRKLQHYFPVMVNICAYHGHKKRQKDENSMFFIDIHPALEFGPH